MHEGGKKGIIFEITVKMIQVRMSAKKRYGRLKCKNIDTTTPYVWVKVRQHTTKTRDREFNVI